MTCTDPEHCTCPYCGRCMNRPRVELRRDGNVYESSAEAILANPGQVAVCVGCSSWSIIATSQFRVGSSYYLRMPTDREHAEIMSSAEGRERIRHMQDYARSIREKRR